ncbi:ROK family protein [Romboutsia sp.]|uniref:ROK family protein n=1 Tax=Romboutsia sp. TaxID=1965302 RepID=UPI003F352940
MTYCIGMDIGGTNIRAALLDENYNIVDKFKIENNVVMGPEVNIDKLCNMIKEKWSNYDFKSIGIGCPGPLDLRKGKIINPPNLKGWENFEIKEYIQSIFKIPVVVNNDANVAGYSEAKVGAGKDAESVYYITLSTGVGGGFIYKGEIVNGFNNVAAELCNMIINEDKYSHSGLNQGGLEGQCSGVNISRIASEKLGISISTKEVFEKASLKEKACEEVLEQWVVNVSKAIANIIVIVDPEVVVLGGSVILNNASYLDKIIDKVKAFVFKEVNVNIKLAQIGDDTGLIGSGIMALSLLD